MNKLTVGSLFSGIGGIELGLERTNGFEVKWQVEIDEYATKVLAKHWPDVTRFRDIRECGSHNLTPVDLICGGFPCQDISTAGKRVGITGSRSGLWSEFYRIICELRPRYVLVENVSALLFRGMGRVLGDLAASGYDAEWQVLSAESVGAPHLRERVFIVAYTNSHESATAEKSTINYQSSLTSSSEWIHSSYAEVAHTISHRSQASIKKSGVFQEEGDTRIPEPNIRRGPLIRGPIPKWDIWANEPNMDRVADGIPFELDFIRGVVNEQSNGTETKSETNSLVWTILRKVWECQELAKTSPELYIRTIYNCVPTMPYKHPYGGWLLGKRIEEDQGLRDLWQAFYTASFQEAQDMQPRLLERIGKKERPKEMGFRVDRIRGLGNAVVPQIAEYIGRCILAALESEGVA